MVAGPTISCALMSKVFTCRTTLGDQIEIVTPRDENFRGCQLSLQVNLQNVAGKAIHEKLEATGVRTDWREPNVIRAAPVPFYNSYSDVFEFCKRLKKVLSEA